MQLERLFIYIILNQIMFIFQLCEQIGIMIVFVVCFNYLCLKYVIYDCVLYLFSIIRSHFLAQFILTLHDGALGDQEGTAVCDQTLCCSGIH